MTGYITPPRCEHCGQRTARLLRSDIHKLITDFTLPEVLDRFAEMVHTQSELPQNESLRSDWSNLCILLEKATDQALAIAELKHRKGEEVWD